MTRPEKTPSPIGGRYACTACNSEGSVDEDRYRVLTETPGPLYIPLSQRRSSGESPYVFKVTNKNASREDVRKRRLQKSLTTSSDESPVRRKRSKRAERPATSDGRVDDLRGEDTTRSDVGSSTGDEEDDTESHASTTRRTPPPLTSPNPASEAVPVCSSESPTSTPGEVSCLAPVSAQRSEAEAMLKRGLGRDQPPDSVIGKILDGVLAVAGPAAMEDILGFCRKRREGMIYQTSRDVHIRTAALRAEWEGRLPESEQKSAIVDVHVAEHWAVDEDTNDFVRSVLRRMTLAGLWEAFEKLLHPKTKPNPGWKVKRAQVLRVRMSEAHPTLETDGEAYRLMRKRFEGRLRSGERWSRLRREFGPGVFALLPCAVFTNKWVEQMLTSVQFDTWLNVLGCCNPPDKLLVARAGELIGKALAGEPPLARLRLEGTSPTDIARACRDPTLLFPCVDEIFEADGAFLDDVEVEVDIT